MSDIVIVSGSPSSASSTDRVLHFLGYLAAGEGYAVKHISVKDVQADDLLFGNYNSPDIKAIESDIIAAKGVIIGTPVYKSSYSGVLKALIDLMPQDVLENKPTLPLMTGGSPSHLLALEYALKPLLASLKAQNLKGLYVLSEQLDKTKTNPFIDQDILNRSKKQLYYFLGKLKEKEAVLL